MADASGSSSLFAVFLLSILTLLLIPITIYKLVYGAEGDDEVVQPWLDSYKRKSGFGKKFLKLFKTSNLLLLLGWVACGFLYWYVQMSAKDMTPFDPYAILQISPGATEKEIKKAYRNLAPLYHPDKNPDPKAHVYFAEYLTKAYQALTDEKSRKNYEKYGHPDGPQAVNLGIALPEWFFSKDERQAPLLLAALVGGGILLPLAVAACYLLRSNKFAGPNQMHPETLQMFFRSKYCIKESQGLSRIPETLVIAMEFILMPIPPEQQLALEEVRKTVLRLHPDLKDKSQFWKRRASVVKVHMLLLVHLAREPIPDVLMKDLKYILQRSQALLEEMTKIAALPRPPSGYGWLTPCVACIEMSQSLVQAVPLSLRKPVVSGGKGGQDGMSLLVQLPHMDNEVIRKLTRKRIKGLSDLMALTAAARKALLEGVGVRGREQEEVEIALMALPSVTVSSVELLVEGMEDEDVMEGDLLTCRVRLLLNRDSHRMLALTKDTIRGKVQAFAPHYPLAKEETWWLFLAESVTNQMIAMKKETLLEAEQCSLALAVEAVHGQKLGGEGGEVLGKGNGVAAVHRGSGVLYSEGPHPEVGQMLELKFRSPKAGKRELQLFIMCDSWIGVDRVIPLKVKINEQTRAEQEGRTFRGKATAMDGEDAADAGEDEEEDEDDEDYDSEESGTEESGDEDEDADAAESDEE